MPEIQRFHVRPRYSEYCIHAGTVYLSGQVPSDTTQDIKGQTAEVLACLEHLLNEAGSSKAHLLTAQIFLADMSSYADMNTVWDAWLSPGHAPARATVQATLADPAWKIEIVVVAALC